MELFDTHAHLDDQQFNDDRPQVIQNAVEAGVTRMIAVGCTAADSRSSVEIARAYPQVYASVGIQPNYTHEVKPSDWDQIVALSGQPRVVALGETGLDRHWDYAPFETQQDYFDRHLRLSQQTGLPFVVHMRDCGADIVEMLTAARSKGELRGVMHSFTGDCDLMQQCLDLGLYISFAGMVTFKKSTGLREVAAATPADRILIETDSPYLSPHPHRSKRPNQPAMIVHTAQCIATARGVTLEAFAALSTANALTLFDRCG